jgi:hypothetical protein
VPQDRCPRIPPCGCPGTPGQRYNSQQGKGCPGCVVHRDSRSWEPRVKGLRANSKNRDDLAANAQLERHAEIWPTRSSRTTARRSCSRAHRICRPSSTRGVSSGMKRSRGSEPRWTSGTGSAPSASPARAVPGTRSSFTPTCRRHTSERSRTTQIGGCAPGRPRRRPARPVAGSRWRCQETAGNQRVDTTR